MRLKYSLMFLMGVPTLYLLYREVQLVVDIESQCISSIRYLTMSVIRAESTR